MPARAIGFLLIGGAVVFWIGALTPPYRQWMGVSLDEYLRIVAAHPRAWLSMHACFAAGSVLTCLGIVALAREAGTLFTLATGLWLVIVGHRLGVTPNATATESRASHAWMSFLFGAHMVASYLAIAALGVALRDTALPRWVSTLAIVFGLLAIPGLATPVFQPPLMIHVVPFVVGVSILIHSKGTP